MRNLRTLLPVLILGAVSLAFVGASAAMEGDDPPVVDEPTTVAVPDCSTAPAGEPEGTVEGEAGEPCEEGADDTDGTEVEDDGSEAPDETLPEGADDTTPAEHPENHGAAVSEAAHSCPPGPEHGPCVSEVARSDAGQPAHDTPDDGEIDDDEIDDRPDVPVEARGDDKGDRGSHGHGRG